MAYMANMLLQNWACGTQETRANMLSARVCPLSFFLSFFLSFLLSFLLSFSWSCNSKGVQVQTKNTVLRSVLSVPGRLAIDQLCHEVTTTAAVRLSDSKEDNCFAGSTVFAGLVWISKIRRAFLILKKYLSAL